MPLSAETLVLLLGALAAPAILVVLNFIVRKANKWYYTAGSDFLFTEMGFSFASAILWKDMSHYIPNSYIRDTFWADFTILGLIILSCWVWTVSRVEPMIYRAIQRRQAAASLPQTQLFLAWGLAVGFFAIEVMVFLYRGAQ